VGKPGAKKIAVRVHTPSIPNDPRQPYKMPLSNFTLVIELPQSMTDHIIAISQDHGINFKTMTQQSASDF
jgi:hypothetical protein